MFQSIRRLALISVGAWATVALLTGATPAARSVSAVEAPRLLSPLATQTAAAADAATHKQWMNDASDAQENFRFALTDRDQKAAQEALVALESLMGKTEEYWRAKKAADGVKLAVEAHVLAGQAVSQYKAGNLSAAQASFDKMGAACNACHELQLEKR